jgi:hypothetical protein
VTVGAVTVGAVTVGAVTVGAVTVGAVTVLAVTASAGDRIGGVTKAGGAAERAAAVGARTATGDDRIVSVDGAAGGGVTADTAGVRGGGRTGGGAGDAVDGSRFGRGACLGVSIFGTDLLRGSGGAAATDFWVSAGFGGGVSSPSSSTMTGWSLEPSAGVTPLVRREPGRAPFGPP